MKRLEDEIKRFSAYLKILVDGSTEELLLDVESLDTQHVFSMLNYQFPNAKIAILEAKKL